MYNSEISDILKQAFNYKLKSLANKECHYKLAHSANYKNRILGIAATIVSTVVGTAIFATLSKYNDMKDANYLYIKIATGLLSVLAAVLAALQTFLGLNEKANKSKKSAYDYEIVNNKIDFFLLERQSNNGLSPDDFREKAINGLKVIIDLYEKASLQAPTVSQYLYNDKLYYIRLDYGSHPLYEEYKS